MDQVARVGQRVAPLPGRRQQDDCTGAGYQPHADHLYRRAHEPHHVENREAGVGVAAGAVDEHLDRLIALLLHQQQLPHHPLRQLLVDLAAEQNGARLQELPHQGRFGFVAALLPLPLLLVVLLILGIPAVLGMPAFSLRTSRVARRPPIRRSAAGFPPPLPACAAIYSPLRNRANDAGAHRGPPAPPHGASVDVDAALQRRKPFAHHRRKLVAGADT